jgi:signal transduction histidine kinase
MTPHRSINKRAIPAFINYTTYMAPAEKKISPRIPLLIFTFSIHTMILLQFNQNTALQSIYGEFIWQFYLLLSLSFLLSALPLFQKKGQSILVGFHLLTALLIAYPSGGDRSINILLLLSLAWDTALFTPPSLGQPLSCLILIPFIFIQGERSAFHSPVMRTNFPDLILLFLLPFFTGQIAFLLKNQYLKKKELEETINRLDLASARLIDANMGYQNYAEQLEARTVEEERRRISREIHDTVGYGLTNVRVMLEAGAIQIERKPLEAKKLILRAMEEARNCLEETRKAMGELRGREKPDFRGLAAISRMVRAFEASTGIKVNLNLGKAPFHFSEKIDRLLYRTVQEGMTNAFRHGRADKIDIMFWEDEGILSLLIRDNGKGTPSVKEGIGLLGMKERLESIGGSISYGNGAIGFQIRAYIPLPGEGRNGE